MSEVATDIDRYVRVPMVSPDAMSAAAAYLQREYGYSGYRIGVESEGLFRVRCSAGGEFHVVSDHWGNVTDVRDGETVGMAWARLAGENR